MCCKRSACASTPTLPNVPALPTRRFRAPAGLVLPEPEPGHFALLDPAREAPMQAAIRAAGADGDSVGGVLETIVTGVPAGVGGTVV